MLNELRLESFGLALPARMKRTVSSAIQMKTHVFGIGEIKAGLLTLGSATNDEGEALRFRAVGVAAELNGRVQFHAHLQELDEIGVVACMVTCERSELPQKVWVSAQVEGGRITGLGKTNLQASEVMGILGGVLHEMVLFIDPILSIGKVAVPSAGKKKRRQLVFRPIKNEEENNGIPVNAAPAPVPQVPSPDLTSPPPVAVETTKESVADNGEVPPLHDRVEVLNPQALESFPCTSSHVGILDNGSVNKEPTNVKGKKKKHEPGSSPNGENGVNATAIQDSDDRESNKGATAAAGTSGPLSIDPNLMLKGADGKDIADQDFIF